MIMTVRDTVSYQAGVGKETILAKLQLLYGFLKQVDLTATKENIIKSCL
jgi:hypothetical protein